MGQSIGELARVVIGDVASFVVDRNLASMATRGFEAPPSTVEVDDVPARIAYEIFESDDAVSRVFVTANAVQVTRTGGWDESSAGSISSLIEDLFRFYD